MTSVLITGGTGSFGQALVRRLLADPEVELADPAIDRVVVFSRDELKQHEMRLAGFDDHRLRFFIGDVRDRDRLRLAMDGIDTVVHAAALKQVDTCEYNPLKAKKTNVDGAANVVSAARDSRVSRVIALGTDKAVDPTNLYGATKLVAEKLVVDANESSATRFAGVRYGNVISSRGSVLPLFAHQHAAGRPLTVTDPGMTRFVLTLEQAVEFVLDCLAVMVGGEVFVPKLPGVTVRTIAEAVACPYEPRMVVSGMRPGEKRHELLISEHESHRVLDCGGWFVVAPVRGEAGRWQGEPVERGFRFGSDTTERLDVVGFRGLAGLGATLAAAL